MQPCETIWTPSPMKYSKRLSKDGGFHCSICGTSFKLVHSRAFSNSFQKGRILRDKHRRMALHEFDIDPEELHQLVWEIPITDIVELFGVTRKVIEKRCRLLGIPIPQRAYWTNADLKQEDQV